MSRPAASCALMMAATASRYCSRKSESPSIVLNERPCRLESYHKGRGYDPVIAVGRIMSFVVVSIVGSDRDGGDARGATIATPVRFAKRAETPALLYTRREAKRRDGAASSSCAA